MGIEGPPDLYAALGRGDAGFQELIGTAEGQWLDFKKTSYRLDDLKGKLELAKDVSAFANASGGVILIGVETARDVNRDVETASRIRPVPFSLVDFDQIRKIVRQYVYPPVRELQCRIWRGSEPDTGLATIEVPGQDEGEKFFIVTQGLDVDGETHSNLVGVYVRDGADCLPHAASYLHELLRTGRQARRPLPSDRGRGSIESTDLELGSGAADERLQADLEASGIGEEPWYYVQAWQRPGFAIADIHDPVGFRRAFKAPGQLRPNGFNIDFGGDVEVLPDGGLRRSRNGVRSLSVTPSGLLTLIVGSYYLGWAMEQSSGTRDAINPLVLTELTVETCRFNFGHVVDEPVPTSFFRAGLRNLDRDGPTRLPAEVPQFGVLGNELHEPPGGIGKIDVGLFEANTAEDAAFQLLAAVYERYGQSKRGIPAVNLTLGRIDFEKLAGM